MNWFQYIKRTAVRRVVWIVAGLVVYAVLSAFGVVHAQSVPDYANCHNLSANDAWCPSQSEAVSAATALANQQASGWTNPNSPAVLCPPHYSGVANHATYGQWVRVDIDVVRQGIETCGVSRMFRARARWLVGQQCTGTETWRPDLGRCFDLSECSARNQQSGFGVQTTANYREECIAGCTIKVVDVGEGVVCSTVGGAVACSGGLEWTGDQCPMGPTSPPEYEPPARPDKATCIPAPDNHSACLKPNGDHCYTASTGREICWKPGETGDKSDRDVMQKRDPGPDAIPPANLNLPTGDTLAKDGESITTVTTREQGGSTTTTITTTTNYRTEHGTNPGAGDQGAPSDGSGGAAGGEGDSETGSIDGGGDCDTPPIGRGGDAQLVAIVDQAWATRCAVEAGNSVKVTGDVEDCSAPFTVEGDHANAHQLRAMREQICGTSERGEREGISGGLDGTISAMEGEFSVSDIWGQGDGGEGIVSTRYGGGGSCPVIEISVPVLGTTWTPPPVFCSVIAALRLLFITLSTVWALRIIGD